MTLEWKKFADSKPRKGSEILVIDEGIIIECKVYGTDFLVERTNGHKVMSAEHWCKKPPLPKGCK